MNKRVYELDVIKMFLMLFMVFRHLPLYLFNKPLVEFSIEKITLYSLFIPVTVGFISVLGISLGLSNRNRLKVSYKHLREFLKLFLLSLLFGLITYYRLFRRIEIGHFLDYFFLCKRNLGLKPGFYILFPISLLFLYSFIFQFVKKKYRLLFIIMSIIVFILFMDLYSFYYLLCSILFFSLGYFFDLNKIVYAVKKWYLLIISILSYVSVFFLFDNLNIAIELFMMLMLSVFIINISNIFIFLKSIINSITSSILYFYIIHVVILNIIKGRIVLDNWVHVFIGSIALFVSALTISVGYVKIRNIIILRIRYK